MKRIHDIFPFMTSYRVLYIAYLKLKANSDKRHMRRVIRFEKDLVMNLLRLCFMLKAQTWKMGNYRHMFRPESGKLREIWYSSNFGCLVVQCAIGITLGKLLNNSLIEDTYAGIPGRSMHKGMRRLFRKIKSFGDRPIFVYKLDMKQFYASIDHELLKQALAHKIKDKRALALLYNIIDNCPLKVGLPIGNFLSPILANFYLNALDRMVKNAHFAYYRYNDDIIALSDSKDKLHILKDMVHAKAAELKLTIKKNEQIYPIERGGIDFMGYIVQRKRVLVRRRIEKHMRRDARKFGLHPTPHRAKALSSRWGWFKRVKSGKNFWFKQIGCTIDNFNDLQVALCS